MLVFGSEMHLVTFVVIVLEFGMLFFYQLPHYFVKPEDKSRLWYMLLLILLIIYNTAGGLMPDEDWQLSVVAQNNIAYGTGFMVAAYFPLFFYKCLQYGSLWIHALLLSPIFILLPYVIFFLCYYSITGDLELPTSYGMILPFLYSIWVLYAILKAIRRRFRDDEQVGIYVNRFEAMMLYCAVLPWVLMTVFAFVKIGQWIEVLCTNIGFLLTTIVFMTRSVRQERRHNELTQRQITELALNAEEIFYINSRHFDISQREKEIVSLIRLGLTNKQIGERLFISEKTVSNHLIRINQKTGAKTRTELIHILFAPRP